MVKSVSLKKNKMEHKKLFSVIAAVMGLLFMYALYNFFMSFARGYSLEWQFFLYFIPVGAGITGLTIFIASGFKKSGLLRVYMCYEIISFPFTLLFYIGFFTNNNGGSAFGPVVDWHFYVGVLIDILYIACSALGLWYLSKKRVPNIFFIGEGENRVGQFEPAGAGLRFANRLIDGVMVLVVLVKGLGSLYYWINQDLVADSPALIYVFEIPLLLMYYLLLESIFNTTAGKCATNTTIVNDSGGRPAFGQVLGRTFCRLIPFEAFSFFGAGARGWHDSITNTYVVQSIDADDAAANEITLDAETNPVQL